MFVKRLAPKKVGSEVRKSALGDDNPGMAVGGRALTRSRQAPERAMVSTRACAAHCHRPFTCMFSPRAGEGAREPPGLASVVFVRKCPPFCPPRRLGTAPPLHQSVPRDAELAPGHVGVWPYERYHSSGIS